MTDLRNPLLCRGSEVWALDELASHLPSAMPPLNLGHERTRAAPGYAVYPTAFSASDITGDDDSNSKTTNAVYAAMQAALAAKAPLVFHPGSYLLDTSILNWAAAKGLIIRGAGKLATILRPSLADQHGLEVSGGWTHSCEIADLSIVGPGREATTGHGIYFHDNGPYAGAHGLLIRDVSISGFGGRGIYLAEQWFTRLSGVEVDDCGHNLFDLEGGNTTVLTGCYAHRVARGRAGYRIHRSATLIGCNGIDSAWDDAAYERADWGHFGHSVLAAWTPSTAYVLGDIVSANSEQYECMVAGTSAGAGGPDSVGGIEIADGTCEWRHIGEADVADLHGVSAYFKGVLLNCNIEDFGRHGLRLTSGSRAALIGTSFTPPDGGSPIAIVSDHTVEQSLLWPSRTLITESPIYADGCPIHAIRAGATCPVIEVGTATDLTWRDHATATTQTAPTIALARAGYLNTVFALSRLQTRSIAGTIVSPTYGASVAIDPRAGNIFDVYATDGAAFAIARPMSGGSVGTPPAGASITIRIWNSTGGALGEVTWHADYHLAGAWTAPGAGKMKAITLLKRADAWGCAWDEISRTDEVST